MSAKPERDLTGQSVRRIAALLADTRGAPLMLLAGVFSDDERSTRSTIIATLRSWIRDETVRALYWDGVSALRPAGGHEIDAEFQRAVLGTQGGSPELGLWIMPTDKALATWASIDPDLGTEPWRIVDVHAHGAVEVLAMDDVAAAEAVIRWERLHPSERLKPISRAAGDGEFRVRAIYRKEPKRNP